MVWLTHAIGWATTVLWANLLAPQYFPISLWLIILSFYIGQGPDIDIKKSSITRNPYIKVFIFWILPFISGHRAKETHSLFWTAVYWFLSLPFIFLFWVGGWFVLVLAYFSHIFLDFFNPTGVKIFYIPFLNPEPRSWSLYNTIPHLAAEIPFLLKKLLYINKRKERRKIQRSQIKYDGVGVLTGSGMEKTISLSLWLLFIVLLVLQLEGLKESISTDILLLSLLFPLYILITYSLVKKNIRIFQKYHMTFKYSFGIAFLLAAIAYFWKESPYTLIIKDASYFWILIFVTCIGLIPLVYYLGMKFFNSVKEAPQYLFWKSWNPDIYDYSILTQLLLVILLVFSISEIPQTEANLQALVGYVIELDNKKDIFNDSWAFIQTIYKEGLEESTNYFKEIQGNTFNSVESIE